MSRWKWIVGLAIWVSLTAFAQLHAGTIVHETAELSVARSALAGTATATRAMFVGGWATGYPTDRVDYYDAHTGTWSTGSLPPALIRQQAASTGGFAVIAGGDDRGGPVDNAFLFDDQTSEFTAVNPLQTARYGHVAVAVGNKIMFAGGDENGASNYGGESSAVDIYDTASNAWMTDSLSVARQHLGTAATGNIAMFAGGYISSNSPNPVATNLIDVYHADTGAWTTDTLSQARGGVVGTSLGNKLLFAGGWNDETHLRSNVVDIYDAATNQWTAATLSQARSNLVAATAGDYVFFAGGYISDDVMSDVVDVYDTVNDSWSVLHLSQARWGLAAASVGDSVLFAGGHTGLDVTSRVDIFTVSQPVSEPTSFILWTSLAAMGLINVRRKKKRP